MKMIKLLKLRVVKLLENINIVNFKSKNTKLEIRGPSPPQLLECFSSLDFLVTST